MSLRLKSFEVLPALSIRRRNLRVHLRTVTMAWMMGVVWMCAIGGSHVKSFARMLGFNDLAFGFMAAMPFLATIGQIPATLIVERTGHRKYLFLYCTIISRLLWMPVALIPLMPIPSPWAVVTMLSLLGVSWFLASMGGPAWFSWMGDIIPRRIRGRYMAHRTRLASAVQIVVVIALGLILDAVTIPGAAETATAQPNLLIVCCIAFVIAGIMGTADIAMFFRLREVMPTILPKPRVPIVDVRIPRPQRHGVSAAVGFHLRHGLAVGKHVLLDPLRDRAFRSYVFYAIVVTFSASVCGWYYWLQSMEKLGFSKLATNMLFMVIGPIAGIYTSNAWGKATDRWGRRPVLIVATIGTIFSGLPWLFITHGTPHPAFIDSALAWAESVLGSWLGRDVTLLSGDAPIGAYLGAALGCVIGGTAWTGIGLAQTSIMLGFADGPGRSRYVAASGVLISVGGALGGVLGGFVAQELSFLQDAPLGVFLWNNWHVTIGISMLSRVFAVMAIINMPDPGAGRVRDLIRLVGVNIYDAAWPRLFYRIRTIGWWKRPSENHEHEKQSDKQPRQ